jgi:hypothetical protein
MGAGFVKLGPGAASEARYHEGKVFIICHLRFEAGHSGRQSGLNTRQPDEHWKISDLFIDLAICRQRWFALQANIRKLILVN